MDVCVGKEVRINFQELEKDVNKLIDGYKQKSMDDISNQVKQTVAREKTVSNAPSQKFSIKQFKALIEELKAKFDGQTVTLDEILAKLDISKDRKVVGIRMAIMADEKRHADLIDVSRVNDKFLIKKPTK